MKPKIYYTKPSITELEVIYVIGAATSECVNRRYDYLNRFEIQIFQHQN